MKPRDFLRGKENGTAILLTWSIDPVFFERLPLRHLRTGGVSRVLVVADRGRLHETANELSASVGEGRVRDLGRLWALDGVTSAGAFHPKLWLRANADGGQVMIGSGNLTAFGFGGQSEVGAHWAVGGKAADDGAWLRPVLEDVRAACGSESSRALIEDVLALEWLNRAPRGPADVLWSGRATLASQLASRWSGRRFTSMTMLTGSTDVEGAFLRWTATTFGVERATVILTPARASFDPAALSRLPLGVRIAAFRLRNQPLHAKVLWLDGPDGPAAVMGSANCSASAWLRPIPSGGNHELVAVYDAPDLEAFAELLVDARDAVEPANVLPAKRAPTEEDSRLLPPPYDLVQLDWDGAASEIVARLIPNPSGDAVVELRDHDGAVVVLRPAAGTWRGTLNIAGRTAGWCVVRSAGREFVTPFCCLADTRQLLDTGDQRRWHAAIDGLRDLGNAEDQRRIVDDLVRLSSTLFLAGGASAGTGAAQRQPAARGEASSAALDPAMLASARAYAGASARPQVLGRSAGSLSGLLRAVFRFDTDTPAEEGEGSDAESDADDPGDDAELTPGSPGPPAEPLERAELAHVTFDRLDKQVHRWLSELSSDGFVARCTAEELLQGYAFPIALALVGLASGWLSRAAARTWVEPCVARLLATDGFSASYNRLDAAGREVDLRSRFGDGHLLAAAVVATAVAGWDHALARAVWMRRLLALARLHPTAGTDHLGTLLGAVRVTDEHALTRAEAIEDVAGIDAVERDLRAKWLDLAAEQAAARGQWMREGDILFALSGRWGYVQGEARLGSDANVEVDWFDEVGPGGSMRIEHKGKPFLINLSLLHRRGVPPVVGYPTLGLPPTSSGPRERQSVSMGLTRA